jgi:predicted RNase H-like nuclease (RuvC/YqgF family)
MTPLDMEKRIRNLTTYISKAKSGKKKYKMSIEEMQSEINELRRNLDGII